VEPERAEGLVAINLHSTVGARGCKAKIKTHDTVDCIVLEQAAETLLLRSFRGIFRVQWRGARSYRPGQIVAVAHEGYYPSGLPRFPRVARLRQDLAA